MAVKILNATQIKELDRYTIAHEPIASIDLMERASRAFTEWFMPKFLPNQKVIIVCGIGNNGGDGLAIARMLSEYGYAIDVVVLRGTGSETNDFKTNLERLPTKIKITELHDSSLWQLDDSALVIDAIFGAGLSRPPEGIYAGAIRKINATGATVIAVDLPSGLRMDSHSDGEIVEADYTVSFQLPKLAFLFPENAKFVGEWLTLDIGLDREFLRQCESRYLFIDRKAASKLTRPRQRFSHKGTYGHALLLAGSFGKMGAAVLAGRAALRAGVGLLTLASPKCGYEILQTSVAEALVEVDPSETHLSTLPALHYQSIAIGPGIGKHQQTVALLNDLFIRFNRPIVLDADALNILSENRSMLERIPKGSILTPHPKEFERLVGPWQNDFERLEKQKQLAQHLTSIVVLKGAFSSIAVPGGQVYFNSTGNPGMATGGSGDVLTGILVSLLAQGYEAEQAAILGVFLHGSAGDLAAYELGMDSLTASDIIQSLPQAFKLLKNS